MVGILLRPIQMGPEIGALDGFPDISDLVHGLGVTFDLGNLFGYTGCRKVELLSGKTHWSSVQTGALRTRFG